MMVGKVGDDAFARTLRQNLLNESISDQFIGQAGDVASGLAIVAVDDAGQNSIMVVSGANACITPDDVDAAADAIAACDAVLVQLEIPLPAVQRAIQVAQSAEVRVILDPAPAPESSSLPDELYHVDLICPNESEAAVLTGVPVTNKSQAETAAKILLDRGARNVAITMGAAGTMLATSAGIAMIPAFHVDAVDSTAAGDAFAGAAAVHWSRCEDLTSAVRFGNAAGAFSAARHGAQPSMGTHAQLDEFVASQIKTSPSE
jgi:ribokinase